MARRIDYPLAVRRLGVIVVVAWSSLAHAYEERIHRLLEERALAAAVLDLAVSSEAASIRSLVWRAGAEHPDAEVRRRFLARWPTEWDDWSFKEFLGLTPEAKVVGIDVLPGPAARVRDVLVPAASQPDEDRRNQNRFAHDKDRNVREDAWKRPLPADPAQLDMGPLKGLASQAYAHYGLPKVALTDDPAVLKMEPRRWAYPPTARAFAPAFAQMFTDLALVAAARGGERDPMAWLFLGHAHHYLADVCNQIHTLQAIYDFFYDAKIESFKEEFFTLGGLVRPRRGFVSIGIDIIGNHHLLSEDLWSKRVLEAKIPEVQAALDGLAHGDDKLEQQLGKVTGPDFARAMTEIVVDASSFEGGAAYQAIRELAVRRLSRAGEKFDDGMDPDESVRPDADKLAFAHYYQLQAAGFARAGTALRRHVAAFRAAIGTNAAERLVATQLAALDEREARLAGYTPRAPEQAQVNWIVPGGLFSALILLALLIRRMVRRARRRRQ
jgi:hypothetical protein